MRSINPAVTAAAVALAAGLCATASAQLTTVRVASGLVRPLYVTHAPGDPERLFIVQQGGLIRILKDGSLSTFIDLTALVSQTGNERGLLSMTFHPDYQNNGLFYVDYTLDIVGQDPTIVAEYQTITDDLADPTSERIIMRFNQDFSNHNGGWIDFGPDGFLYIAAGDGGSGNDPNQRAQDLSQFLGKMHRIDVDSGDDFPADPNLNFAIPDDNPFILTPNAQPSIWAYGLRNPWRPAFDRLTGDLYIADVGQGAREEVNFQLASSTGGENYGWRCMEGTLVNITVDDCDPFPTGLTPPIHEYTRGGFPFRCAITGGVIYRGCAIPELDGTYFYADSCSNQIWSFQFQNGAVLNFMDRTTELAPGGGLDISSISSFGEDFFGEVYICDLFGGEVFKIVPVIAPPDINNNGIADRCECLADLSGSADPNSPAFGVPDGVVDANDFFFYLDRFAAGDLGVADLTGSLDPNDPGFGVPDGILDANDFFFYLDLFAQGCP